MKWFLAILVMVGVLALAAGCAFTKYDENGNVIEHWEPPTPEQLEGYLTAADRLADLIDKLKSGDATTDDRSAADRLVEYVESEEGQAAMDRASARTTALIQQLIELRQAQSTQEG